ncbi:hypothetical protein [Nocardioides abyssi]|uniref:Uncharacterized protein n=1 Tax=Nocardioides abyssi TaxID=3058370 RepID=A0ABT8ESG1_9ACTN|nr:hypothetical protein [Nocardioides abyssi]MDN4161092.1 hypothetical protein [Nocardioides abyssi]
MDDQPVQGGGWFAYAPKGMPDDFENPPVRDVYLRADEYGGPYWSTDGALGPDYEDVHHDLGISRSLHDDVTAWNDAALAPNADADAIFARQQDLLRRLTEEVRAGIEVPAPRSAPPLRVALLDHDFAAEALPEPLAFEVLAWRADAPKYAYATGDNDAEIWAWQDLGAALAARVGAVLGDDYAVRPF